MRLYVLVIQQMVEVVFVVVLWVIKWSLIQKNTDIQKSTRKPVQTFILACRMEVLTIPTGRLELI